ncbi:MAG: PIG-L deacetylase family protein [Nanoarchaeota archaeon]|nr:PIG-L deacetylase family protein [Nanoarchaeota archaeon]
MVNKKNNILVVGAHPDDVELGCGGTIAKHLFLEDNVFILVMTNGDKGSHTLDMQECLASMKVLGISRENIFFASFEDGFLADSQEVVNLIESYIKRLNINRVYTHHPNDRHQDHRHCSYAVSSAARKIAEIFLFQGPSTKHPFEPHYFVELSQDHLKKKIEALNCYKSQVEKGIVDVKWIEHLAGFHGIPQQSSYAEAFAINHVFKRGEDV